MKREDDGDQDSRSGMPNEDQYRVIRTQKQLDHEERVKIHKQKYFAEAIPILKELSEAGFQAENIGDLYHKNENIKHLSDATPILLRWLPKVKYPGLKEDIVRSLATKYATPIAASHLIDEYVKTPNSEGSLKWAIGNSLAVVADDSVFDAIAGLTLDPDHGKSREMVVVALGNMKRPEAVDVLIKLLTDDQVAGHALLALRKLGAKKAQPCIEPFLKHPKTWVRNEAKKAIAKLDKLGKKS